MNKTHTMNLFDIQNVSVKELLMTSQNVWEVLEYLEEYAKDKSCKPIEGVHIEGNVFIGKGSVIRKGAVLRGPIVIGEDCIIGHNVEIVRSLILDKTKIPHLSYVGDSIIGSRVNMGAGSICANVRLDNSEISISGGTATGRNKLGAIIGDGASIGCNAVLNPGCVVLPGAKISPCTNVGGVVK